jgi:N-acyl-D-amino-acid deacylase
MRHLIRDAQIVVGDGQRKPFEGDVLMVDGRITHLGSVPHSEADDADRLIHANGRVLAPGFVDTHNHGLLGGTRIGDFGIPIACELSLRGGVTKRICGVDGLSPAPVTPEQRSEYAAQQAAMDGTVDGGWTWSSVKDFYAWYRGRSIIDMGMYLGHSAVRRVVMGNHPHVATDEQIRRMCDVVRSEAPYTLGLSTGLVYNPAVYSDQRELASLVRAFNEVKPGALFPHLRSESDMIVESLDEVVTAAVEGGGGYCNEHTKVAGQQNWDKYQAISDKIADAAGSVPTMENMYPYIAGSTIGDMIFPPEIRAGSREEFLARISDASARRGIFEKMRGDTTTWDNFVEFCGGLGGVGISGVRDGVGDAFLGKRLGDVARVAGHADLSSYEAYEAVFDFFVENQGEISIITYSGNEGIVERFFRRPSMAICTDGLIPGPGQKPHPRSIGAFPKALRMARELEIPLEEIIYRLSTLPLQFLGLESPVLAPGSDASVVLFDWETVTERNDFDDPMAPPEGIDAVWIHGELVYEEGVFLPPRHYPGRILWSPPLGPTPTTPISRSSSSER